MKKTVLLIGSASEIASCFHKNYSEKYHIIASTRSRDGTIIIDLATKIDLTHIPDKLDVAIFCAGITNIKSLEKDILLAARVNCISTIDLCRVLNARNIPILFISSTAVFSQSSNKNSEYDSLSPECHYGLFKACVENELMLSPINTIIRLPKVIGRNSLLTKWGKSLSEGRPITCFSDLKVAPLPIKLVIDYFSYLIESRPDGIVHLSPDSDISYYELALKLARSLNVSASFIKPILSVESNAEVIYKPSKAFLDCKRTYSQSISLDDSLQIIFEDLKANLQISI